jgi:chromosome segregation ATPase
LAAKRNFFNRKDAYRDAHKSSRITELTERMEHERGLLHKLGRQLGSDEQLIIDVTERMNNLPANLRSYQKKEEYAETLEELKANVDRLRQEVDDLRYNIQQDERELRYLQRPPKKREAVEKEPVATVEAPDTDDANIATDQTVLDEVPEVAEPLQAPSDMAAPAADVDNANVDGEEAVIGKVLDKTEPLQGPDGTAENETV